MAERDEAPVERHLPHLVEPRRVVVVRDVEGVRELVERQQRLDTVDPAVPPGAARGGGAHQDAKDEEVANQQTVSIFN